MDRHNSKTMEAELKEIATELCRLHNVHLKPLLLRQYELRTALHKDYLAKMDAAFNDCCDPAIRTKLECFDAWADKKRALFDSLRGDPFSREGLDTFSNSKPVTWPFHCLDVTVTCKPRFRPRRRWVVQQKDQQKEQKELDDAQD